MKGLGIDGHWIGIHDADPRAIALYRRHYSAFLHHRRAVASRCCIVGPYERMLLLTVRGDALFAWAKPQYMADKSQTGVYCPIFHNESPILSSQLILEAEELAWQRWPGQRLFTYVWDAKVKSPNPGYCFKMAGWKVCGRNKDGRLTILEKLPSEGVF